MLETLHAKIEQAHVPRAGTEGERAMTRKPIGLVAQMEQLIESALAPGRFISYNANYDFVGDLEAAEKQIASLVRTEPELVVSPHETFPSSPVVPDAGLPRRFEKGAG